MALDERYRDRWTIGEDLGVVDSLGRPRAIGVGIHDDRVIMDPRGWVSMPIEVAERLGFHLQSAAAEIRNKQRER